MSLENKPAIKPDEDEDEQWTEAISMEEVAESTDGSDYQRDAYEQWLMLQRDKSSGKPL
ncbi:hypothetical protein [Spirosoma utsteinense]|uniref:Uncharacterized protein n=1 Tax=Spirosoma utsteinense TaxID=2585773 RepID=A0ABR6WDJ3_9BACT|nr:hypothetical protein [Spirosoma utsteinense]MBC3785665.1 hypothetical protein [Spirosoma utsteinense]MBC3794601.1 hypothetical protein [Spirosoma utsteinense]